MRKLLIIVAVVFICGLITGVAFYASIPPQQQQGGLLGGANAQSPEGTIRAYLRLDGIVGESQDVAHRNEIEIVKFSWNDSIPMDDRAHIPIGVAIVDDFQITAQCSKASPVLFQYSALSRQIPKATITLQRTDSTGASTDFLTWTLSDVLITSYTTTYDGTWDSKVTDQISLSFGKASFRYVPMNPDGTYSSPVEAAYEVQVPRV